MQPLQDTYALPKVFFGPELSRTGTAVIPEDRFASEAEILPAADGFRPFPAVRMEHDARRFVVHDPRFCRAVVRMAERCGWHIRTAQTGTRVYAPHILFLVTPSSTLVHSDEPALLCPYADRLARAFGPDTDGSLIAACLREELASDIIYDEGTPVMCDPAIRQDGVPVCADEPGRHAIRHESCFLRESAEVFA